jgi:glycosyltransferase involved in cell wall biosynthesis
MQAKVTVILLTYRRPALLRAALRSVLAQTYRDLLVLVCDDASGDDTGAVMAEVSAQDSRVVYCPRPANVGSMENMRLALHDLRTPYFTILADDDELCPEFLDAAVAALERYPEAAFCGGQTYVWERSTGSRHLVSHEIPAGYYQPEAGFCTLVRHHVAISACLFRTSHLHEDDYFHRHIFPFNESYTLFRLASRLPFVFEARPFFIYDSNPGAAHRDQPHPALEAVLLITANLLTTCRLTPPMKRTLFRWCRTYVSLFSRRAMERATARRAEYRKLADVFQRAIGDNPQIIWSDRMKLRIMFHRLTALRIVSPRLRRSLRRLSGR